MTGSRTEGEKIRQRIIKLSHQSPESEIIRHRKYIYVKTAKILHFYVKKIFATEQVCPVTVLFETTDKTDDSDG